ncbi:MAG: taurine dioxygenase [Alphaproteobacteria bacterium]|nr:taurine dioxygenase [Alphaproteobacteria bacterium]
MTYQHIEVKPISGALGAEIAGVDLSQDIGNAVFSEVQQALHENLVIFFRDQELTPEQHKDFGRRFGTLNIHPQYVPLDGHPEILPILKEPEDTLNIGDVWHTDVSFLEQPSMGSILYAHEVPDAGGDTMFANQYLAYETLSDGMREMLDDMTAVHSDRILSNPASAKNRNDGRSTVIKEDAMTEEEITNEHPVVRTHVDTGRKSLYVNDPFTVRFSGMTEEESQPLLQFLYAHATRPEFTCRFRWEKKSVAFWDNRCTQHYALNDYQGQRRSMHRVTVNGERPI